ncbi:MAG TPA: (S)-ureidoglycine aminohydrolase [Phycisphaerae bacterium]|nr:(S)-ureidoglycine aminohydrolase [Phycisphaerae bacterium]
MREQNQLLGSRARVKARYALLPQEGIPFSRLPEWPKAEVRVLAGPALGAGFAEYLMDLPANGVGTHEADGEIEFFVYVVSGSVALTIGERKHTLGEGGFALIPPDASFRAVARRKTQVLLVRKRYEAAAGIEMFAPLVGNQKDVAGSAFHGDAGARLQVLIPDEMQYDLAMNIFTFEVGHSLPVTETHVMEHGLYVLEGKGVYYLDDTWMEVEATDFIWMGPFCPQSYYATGPVASRYVYYKNVNREIGV